MTRNTAREIAAHLSYELSFTDKTVDELLKERLTPEAFAELAGEDSLYADAPNAKQAAYITRLVKGVDRAFCGVGRIYLQVCKGMEVFPYSAGSLGNHAGRHV